MNAPRAGMPLPQLRTIMQLLLGTACCRPALASAAAETRSSAVMLRSASWASQSVRCNREVALPGKVPLVGPNRPLFLPHSSWMPVNHPPSNTNPNKEGMTKWPGLWGRIIRYVKITVHETLPEFLGVEDREIVIFAGAAS